MILSSVFISVTSFLIFFCTVAVFVFSIVLIIISIIKKAKNYKQFIQEIKDEVENNDVEYKDQNVTCKYCGSKVSKFEPRCPYCSAPINSKKGE